MEMQDASRSPGEKVLPLFELEELSALEPREDFRVGEPPHGRLLVLGVGDVAAVRHYPVPHGIRAHTSSQINLIGFGDNLNKGACTYI